MKVLRKIIEIDEELCDGCGQCVPACEEGAIQIINGKAKLVAEKYCDGLGACLGDCPTGALKLIEREAEEFDEEAVEEYLSELEKKQKVAQPNLACGCPSTNVQVFESPGAKESIKIGTSDTAFTLSNWPVQIKLVPPHAPFFKNADLLVLADCCAVVYPNIHGDFLPGKVVMMGCPKFDNPTEYVEKFAEIFERNDVNSITIVNMEVPCCSGLVKIIEKALDEAQKNIPVEEICLSTRGTILT
ncbi:MAG TPA: 4Fe-4S ferredoxin [Deltaproteobacteria bacterium]|nr:4Fe-4S ferredoxin [Deltaproteobacteria bacterium]